MTRARSAMSRRRFVGSAAAATGSLVLSHPVQAARLFATPRQTPGPFYPTQIPLDADNDLVVVQGRDETAAGDITHIFGRVLDLNGRPLKGFRVELWQCDAFGFYHHPRDRGGQADPNFQGYGTNVTDQDGGYRFRTVKPVPYPGRTPHIHFAVTGSGLTPLTTQMYLKGHPLNERDFIFNRIRRPEARASVLVALDPAPEIEANALAGKFDIILGHNAI